MPGYANVLNYVGNTPPDNFFTPTTEQKFPMGYIFIGVDPYFGAGEFVYGKAVAAQITGEMVAPSSEAWVMTAMPSTAGLGKPILFAKQEMAINTFGWYQRSGMSPIAASASVAADVAVGIGTAGKAGTNTAGKQLLGLVVRGASTFTLTKTATTNLNPGTIKVVRVSNTDGLFVGLTVSGTGIPASSEITAIDPNGAFITMSENATAAGTITMTGTYTGYLLAYYQHPFTQGAIT